MVFSWLNVAVLACLVAGLAFGAGPLLGSVLLAQRTFGGGFLEPYECGMPPHGVSWSRFGINYYFYALIFLAFDVDVLYLFPVAAYYPESKGFEPFYAVFVFMLVLFLAIYYFWKKGVFTWPRKIQF